MNARWFALALCFVGTVINFVDRTNFSIAVPVMAKELNLGPASVGLLLGSFFWLYLIGVIPVGHLLDKWGSRKVYAACMVIWSVASGATGFGWNMMSLMVPRIVMGGAEGASFPTNTKVVALWFPIRQRGIATSIWHSAVTIGSAIAYPFVVFLMVRFGWRYSFVITGVIGVVFGILWYLVYRDPSAPLSEAERAAVAAPRVAERPKAKKIDWRLALHRNIWGLAVGFFCANLVNFFFLSWFPSYLMSARHFSLHQIGTWGALPSISAVAGVLLGGLTTDMLYRRGWSLTAARKTCLVGGLVVSSLIIVAVFASSPWVALAIFCFAYAGITFTSATIQALPGDLAPSKDRVGFVAGVQLIGGIIAPLIGGPLIGLSVELAGGSYIAPVVIIGVFALLGALVYLFLIGTIRPTVEAGSDDGAPALPGDANLGASRS
ncbi:MAG: hypothetical protein BGN87_17850 [Rhizobiales bacterium 65-79]|mgnify:CR=1 FL=1|jgi:MFS family permease|nr:MFS transporter [Hyphomicrobiales bacterium]OJU06816.1 MAG: hypothetical protein BGN87_17850 [Rhizobiales bacterium 65-79]